MHRLRIQRKIAQAQQIRSNFLQNHESTWIVNQKLRGNTVNNRKLTIIAKIRETHTRFLQPTRSECLGYLLVGQIVGPLWRPYERRRVGTYLEVHLGITFVPIKNTCCAWAGGTTKFSRTIDRICWSCFFVLCFMSHRFHQSCSELKLRILLTKKYLSLIP